MKTILLHFSFALALALPSLAFAAFNDVTLTTSSVLSVGSYTLNVTGPSAVIQSINVNSGSFTVTMLAGSHLQVTSPTYQQLTTDNPSLVSSNSCSDGNSVLSLSSPSSSGTVTVTPQSTICSTPTSSGGGGGGLPAVAYMPPAAPTGGFQVVINNKVGITSNPQVSLSLTAGPDSKRMAVSNTADFTTVGQEPFSSSKSWNVCWTNPFLMQPTDCSFGSKTVYVKFFTDWGQASPVVSASIQYQNGGTALGSGAPSNQSGSVGAPYAPDTLVNDHGTVYLIFGNARLGFTSWKALVGLGYSHRLIVRGDTSGYQNSSYLLSDPKQAHPWGSWLLSRGTVYYSHSSGLIGVPSWDVFLANDGKASLLVPANAADLAQPPLNPVLASHDSRVTE